MRSAFGETTKTTKTTKKIRAHTYRLVAKGLKESVHMRMYLKKV